MSTKIHYITLSKLLPPREGWKLVAWPYSNKCAMQYIYAVEGL